jgi:glycerol-3-phosphate dehydrogenase
MPLKTLVDRSDQLMMRRIFSALGDEMFDVLVVGGGIFGAGIARDAVLRGLRVALIDKGDFASGTSSRSSKLIHGGFRYLEQGACRLVMESCRERQVLRNMAPHLVRPMPFLLPVYQGDRRTLGKMRVGMALYDALALYRNHARHRGLSASATAAMEPHLARQGLVGSILYYDCQEDDARFCIENILHAGQLGAVCVNYCELTGFVSRDDRIVAATVTDRIGHGSLEIRAKSFINAAGPWVDQVAGLAGAGNSYLRPTKGVHILLPRLTEHHAITFQGKRDGRIMFIMPWNDCTLVGTTDTDFRGDANDVRADAADLDYLLSEVRALLPDAKVDYSDIITTFAGLRPLLHNGNNSQPSARSREWQIIHHGANFMSIAGGKYTTYRAQAEKIVDALLQKLRQHARAATTAITPLPVHPANPDQLLAEAPKVYASDIRRACEEEMAMTVEDVMRRRTSLALSRFAGPETAGAVARIMANCMSWSESQMRSSLQQYLNQWESSRAAAIMPNTAA